MASTTKQMNITAGNAQATVNATVSDSMPAIPCPDPAGYRYVGARYVPIFANPLQWNSANTYEPLTIVLNEGASYTSKTFVPKGIDISNTDYWALTGNYNAQVEQYRKEVQAFDGRITAIEDELATKPVMIIIGDSWSDKNSSNNKGITTWWELAYSGKYDVHCYAKAGAGFVHSTGTPFPQQATQAVNDDSFDHDAVEKIIVFGVINDTSSRENTETFGNAVKQTAQTLRNGFPEADIEFLPQWYPYKMGLDMQQYFYLEQNNCYGLVGYSNRMLMALANYTTDYAFLADMTHPNQLGHYLLAEAFTADSDTMMLKSQLTSRGTNFIADISLAGGTTVDEITISNTRINSSTFVQTLYGAKGSLTGTITVDGLQGKNGIVIFDLKLDEKIFLLFNDELIRSVNVYMNTSAGLLGLTQAYLLNGHIYIYTYCSSFSGSGKTFDFAIDFNIPIC